MPALESWRSPNTSWGPYNRKSGGRAPSEVQGQSPWSVGQRGQAPWCWNTWLLDVHCKSQICLLLKKFETPKIRYNLCCLFRNDVYRPQYVADYCTVMKSNILVQSTFGKLSTCLFILLLNILFRKLEIFFTPSIWGPEHTSAPPPPPAEGYGVPFAGSAFVHQHYYSRIYA